MLANLTTAKTFNDGSLRGTASLDTEEKKKDYMKPFQHRDLLEDNNSSVSQSGQDEISLQNADEVQNYEMIHSGPFIGPPVTVPKTNYQGGLQTRIVGGQEALPHDFYTMLMVWSDPDGWMWSGW